jgi:hypothetical protein
MTDMAEILNYVGGKWCSASTDKYQDVVNPATAGIK